MTSEELKRKIERVWTTGEHMVNKQEFIEYILRLINQHVAEVIGEDEDEPTNVEHPYYEQYVYETRLLNELKAEQRKKAGI